MSMWLQSILILAGLAATVIVVGYVARYIMTTRLSKPFSNKRIQLGESSIISFKSRLQIVCIDGKDYCLILDRDGSYKATLDIHKEVQE